MSSYRDHFRPPRDGEDGFQRSHSWAESTAKRLAWLYGDQDRSAAQRADLEAWSRLGRRSAA